MPLLNEDFSKFLDEEISALFRIIGVIPHSSDKFVLIFETIGLEPNKTINRGFDLHSPTYRWLVKKALGWKEFYHEVSPYLLLGKTVYASSRFVRKKKNRTCLVLTKFK